MSMAKNEKVNRNEEDEWLHGIAVKKSKTNPQVRAVLINQLSLICVGKK